MKTIIITSVLVYFFIDFGLSQIVPKDTIRWKKVVPEVKIPKIDTIFKLDNWSQSVNTINIPTVLQGKNTASVNMPMVLLSGKGLAPMPGTKNLEKWDNRNGLKVNVDTIFNGQLLNKKERGKN